jgi:hypothetical protein
MCYNDFSKNNALYVPHKKVNALYVPKKKKEPDFPVPFL